MIEQRTAPDCERKARFTSRNSAEMARKRVQRKHESERLTVYFCTNCKGFHLAGVLPWRRGKAQRKD